MHKARRTEYIRVMLTSDEKKLIELAARSAHKTVGRYVRECVFGIKKIGG